MLWGQAPHLRGINAFKRGYQVRNNLVKDENRDLLVDSHNILNRWKNYFSELLNVHNVSDVRQIEVHMARPLVPGPSHLEVEVAIAKLKNYKSPGSDQIPAELIQAGGEILLSEIHKLILFGIRKNCLINGRSLLLYQFTKRVIKLTVIIIVGYHCYQLHNKMLSNIFLSRLVPYIDEITWDHQCGFRSNRSTTDQIFCIRQIPKKNGSAMR
jgi:hypothetical protein